MGDLLPFWIGAALALAFPLLGTGGWAASAAKTGSVLTLAAAAALAGGPGLLVLALGLSALGDLALSRPGERMFLGGVAAFGAAHVVYTVLFLGLSGRLDPFAFDALRWAGLGVLVLLLGIGAAVIVPRAGALLGPVAVYVGLIGAMALAALHLAPGLWLAVAGAALFVVSDLCLALERFVLAPGGRAARLCGAVVWPLYWLGQAAIALGVLGLP